MKAKIIEYQRGNHTDRHVLDNGKTIFSGNISEVKQEMVSMRKFLRRSWHNTSTNDTMKDYVDYNMGDIWVFKMVDGNWVRMYC